MQEPKNFQELVTWACWTIIQGITSGQRLEKSVHLVLDYARRWKPADEQGQG